MTGESICMKQIENDWFDFQYKTFKGQAKIFDEASHFGIGSGRISKLFIKNHLGEVVFNYDRGLDFSTMSSTDLIDIIQALCEGAK